MLIRLSASIILDGEMITWDPRMDVIVAFGTLKTAALEGNRNPYGDGPRPLCNFTLIPQPVIFIQTDSRIIVRVFDILHLNGESLINYTLRDRRTALERSVNSIHRRMEIHRYTEAREAVEIERSLRQVIAEASEGLVIKVCQNQRVIHYDSSYSPSQKNAEPEEHIPPERS